MNGMKLFVAALIVTATALIPKSAPAAAFCSFQQCYGTLGNCSLLVCPPGYRGVPRCSSAPQCEGYCACIQFP